MARVKKGSPKKKGNNKKRYFNMVNLDVNPSPRRTRQRKRRQTQQKTNGSIDSNATTSTSITTVGSADLFYIDTTPSVVLQSKQKTDSSMQNRPLTSTNSPLISNTNTPQTVGQSGKGDSALGTTGDSSTSAATTTQPRNTRRRKFKKILEGDRVLKKYQNLKSKQHKHKKSPFKKFGAVSPKKNQKKLETKSSILRLLGDKTCEASELDTTFENDANLLQDLDLIILAASLEDYEKYTKLLRQEYANMNDENYKQMRLKVLETLLMIPNIFSTPDYQAKFEQAARNNIKWEINNLKSQGN